MPNRRPHAVVIGAGFGGLAAAVRLGARGYRVTVLERLDAPGGRAFVHRQDGFAFDAGPTIITAPFLFEELWALCGRRLRDEITLKPMDPFYRIRFDDGAWFAASGNVEAMRAEVARIAPSDVAGFDRFMARSAEICRLGFEELGHVPFDRLADMAKLIPAMLRLGCHRSVHGLVAGYVKDPRLRQALSFHPLLIGGNPFMASAIYALINHLERRWGVHSVIGGTGRLVTGLADLIEGQGGEVIYGADVTRILVENGRAAGVELADGARIRADVTVSNADAAWTHARLLPAGSTTGWGAGRVRRARHSMGLFVWYFGTNRRYEHVDHHSILLGPRYRELLRDIFGRKHLAADFSLYLHRPTASDPSVAPPGCDAFYALSPVPNLEGEVDWSSMAEPYRQTIAAHLERTLLPDLTKHVVTSKLATPLDFRDRLNAWQGSGFSLEPVLWQSAWFRPHNRVAGIEHLYLVGAGTHPGAGVPGVLSSARILDRVVPDVDVFARA